MFRFRWNPQSLFVVAMAAALGAFALRSATQRPAAPPPGSGLSIGMVDMNAIYRASAAPNELDAVAQQLQDAADKKIAALQAAQYLDPDQMTQYAKLVGLDTLTPAQQAQKAAFEKTAQQDASDLNTLQTRKTPPLTPQEAARMNTMLQNARLLQEQMPHLQDELQTQGTAALDDKRRSQLVTLRELVAQEARRKGIDQVFDSSSMVYSSNDLTKDVISKLPKAPAAGH
ncbi:MAG: hypothetical protein KGJ62_15610 [Armatimonadetes bacterium]|nr:hypothetical protein [Armatimonadota bacterium]MDE2206971.1 hypothetical protein [Armatimonadota bacterium]